MTDNLTCWAINYTLKKFYSTIKANQGDNCAYNNSPKNFLTYLGSLCSMPNKMIFFSLMSK